ncbi:MAG: formate dehydrogenase accessory protein FdhE [Desulfobacterales bacterium]
MKPNRPTPDQIRTAAAELSARQPAYAPLLDFYGEVFVAQEQSREHLEIPSVEIPDELLRIKAGEHMPLLAVSDFQIDRARSEHLLMEICGLAKSLGSTLAPAARKIEAALKEGRIDAGTLFSALIERDGLDMEPLAHASGVEGEPLAFFTYHSIRPSLCHCAERLEPFLDTGTPGRGICPVCGSPPVLSVLKEAGARFLICGFCWQEWSVQRLFCPSCETTEGSLLHHFFDESDPLCRVDLCDKCRKFIKTADARNRSRLFYPPLEQVSTLHLDIRAREMGYVSAADPVFRI